MKLAAARASPTTGRWTGWLTPIWSASMSTWMSFPPSRRGPFQKSAGLSSVPRASTTSHSPRNRATDR